MEHELHSLRAREKKKKKKKKEKEKERRMKKKWRGSGRKRKRKQEEEEEERSKKEKVRSIFKYARPPPPNLCLATNISKSLILHETSSLSPSLSFPCSSSRPKRR